MIDGASCHSLSDHGDVFRISLALTSNATVPVAVVGKYPDELGECRQGRQDEIL
jgi:hypothetical protein